MTNMEAAFHKANIFSREHFKGVSPYGPGRGFPLTLTSWEIPVWILLSCEDVPSGIKMLRHRNLNKVTTRCRTYRDARQQLAQKLLMWRNEQDSELLNYIFHDNNGEDNSVS